VAISKFY